jgi:integrase/recombinase XerD
MPEKVCYAFVTHKNERIILVKFAFNATILQRLKQIANPKWSKTHQCWYVPDTEQMRMLFKLPIVSCNEYDFNNRHWVSKPINYKAAQSITNMVNFKGLQVAAINKHVLDNTAQQLTLMGYSSSTARTYLQEIASFLQDIKHNSADDFSVDRLRKYIAYCLKEKKLSENTVHSRINALKYYYEKVLKRAHFFIDIPRPKKVLTLPKVISEQKILEVLLGIDNLKHKALVFLAYSAGLRVSEVVRLKIDDINEDRMQIFIAAAKGKKDRVVNLAYAALEVLKLYKEVYRPAYYLFESQDRSTYYCIRSAQLVFAAAKRGAGLAEHISFHSLRHSFATHLHEQGVDIGYIQKLLGHNDIKTTMIYTQVSNKSIKNIESPLDKILRKGKG